MKGFYPPPFTSPAWMENYESCIIKKGFDPRKKRNEKNPFLLIHEIRFWDSSWDVMKLSPLLISPTVTSRVMIKPFTVFQRSPEN